MKKKKILFAIILLAAAAACLLALFPAAAAGDVEMSVRVGYSTMQFYRGRPWPIAVTLKNTSEREIRGTVTVKMDDKQTQGYYGTPGEFSREFVLPAGVEKQIEIPVNDENYYWTGMKVVAEDSRGRKLAEKDVAIPTPPGSDYYLVGYITDSAKDAGFGKTMGSISTASGFEPRFEQLYPENFPGSSELLCSFDMLIIGDVDFSASSSFSQKQIDMIRQFVGTGRILLLGMGGRGAEALRIIEPFLASSPSAAARKSDDYVPEVSAEYFSLNGTIKARFDSPMKASKLVDANFNGSNYMSLTHDSLNIAVYPFSLADSEVLNSVDNQMYIFCSSDSYFYSRSGSYSSYYSSSSYYGNSTVTTDVYDRTPSALVIFILMAAYIGLGIIFIFVKFRKSRREGLIWAGIPAAALVFSLLFIGYGTIARGGDSALVLNVVELNGTGKNSAEIVSGVYASNSGAYKINFAGIDGAGVASGSSRLAGISEITSGDVKYGDGVTHVVSGSIKDTYVVSAVDYTDTTYASFEAELTKEGTEDDPVIRLRLKNTSGADLTGVYLYTGYTYYSIGDLARDAELSLDLTDFLLKNRYASADSSLTDVYYDACFSKAGLGREDAKELVDELSNRYGGGYYRYRSTAYEAFFALKTKRTAVELQRALTINMLSYTLSERFAKLPCSAGGIRLWVVAFDEENCPAPTANGRKISRTNGQTVLIQDVATRVIETTDLSPVDFYSDTVVDSSGNEVNGFSFWLGSGEDSLVLLYPICTGASAERLPANATGTLDLQFDGINESYLPNVYLLSNSYSYGGEVISGALNSSGACTFPAVSLSVQGVTDYSQIPAGSDSDMYDPYGYGYEPIYAKNEAFGLEDGKISGQRYYYFKDDGFETTIGFSSCDLKSGNPTRVLLVALVYPKEAADKLIKIDAGLPELTSAEFTVTGLDKGNVDTVWYKY